MKQLSFLGTRFVRNLVANKLAWLVLAGVLCQLAVGPLSAAEKAIEKAKGKGKKAAAASEVAPRPASPSTPAPAPMKPSNASTSNSAAPLGVAAKIDELLQSEVPGEGNKPLKRIDDELFLRRVSLDIVGEIPTPNEVTAFALDPAQDKRAKVVAKLLADPRYGENWGRYFRDVIMYRKTEDRAEIVSASLTKFFKTELNQNSPWSKIATEIVTANGDGLENGATGLIIAQQGQPEETVAEISRIFLGVQIQCAQCHDHPTDRWKREQFHELAAFFPRVASRIILTPERRSVGVTAADNFNAKAVSINNNRIRGSAEHYMPDLEHPEAQGKLMQPVFFATGDKLPVGAKDADRRGDLAKWMTEKQNPYFAKAIVNRLWSELTGEGFYEPVDDIGPDRECTAPKTMEYLAAEFANTNYDLKWLFQTIVATKLYQAPSAPRRNTEQAPFQANVAQRLRGDQLFDNLLSVLGASEPAEPEGMMGPQAFRRSPRRLFNAVYGYDPSTRRDELSGSIPQALALMNGPAVNGSINAKNKQTTLGRLVDEIKDDKALVVELYLRTLGRDPHAKELATALGYVKQLNNRAEAFEDLQWSLLNSTEFLNRK